MQVQSESREPRRLCSSQQNHRGRHQWAAALFFHFSVVPFFLNVHFPLQGWISHVELLPAKHQKNCCSSKLAWLRVTVLPFVLDEEEPDELSTGAKFPLSLSLFPPLPL